MSHLTKKHFEAIANVLREENASPRLVRRIGFELKSTNINFDFEKFLLHALPWKDAHAEIESLKLMVGEAG